MTVKLRKWTAPDGKKKSAWVIRFAAAGPDGVVHKVWKTASVPRREDAIQEELDIRRAILAGTYGKTDVASESVTVRQFAEVWMARNKRERAHGTVLFYEWCLKLIVTEMGDMLVRGVETKHVERFKASLLDIGEHQFTAATTNGVLATLRALLGYAARMGEIKQAPRVDLLPKERMKPKYLNFEQAETCLAHVKDKHPQWHPLFFVSMRTGLRMGELIALQWADVDLKGKRLRVNRTYYRGKEDPAGSAEREIPLSDTCVRVLSSHRHLRGPYVFPRPGRSERMTAASARSVFDSVAAFLEPLGVGEFSPHVLRHTFASHLVMRGIPLKTVSVLMGHKSVTTTEIYSHLAPATLASAVEVLEGSKW